MTPSRWRSLFIGWVVIVLGITTYPWHTLVAHTHMDKIRWISFYGYPILMSDIVGNILLFIPIGLLFILSRLARCKSGIVWHAVLVSAMRSLLAEASQIFNHTRFPTTTDLLSNVVGGTVGGCLGLLWLHWKSEESVEKFTSAAPPR